MKIEDAKTAAVLAGPIGELQTLLARLEDVIAEGKAGAVWRIVQLKIAAPESGSASPAGTVIDLLPFPGITASAENSQMASEQAQKTYANELAALTAQLEAL